MKINIRLDPKIFNPVYLPYLTTTNRYEIYYGGAGSGKSVFVAQKLAFKLLNRRRKLLVVRKVGRTLRDSVFAEFMALVEKWQLAEFVKVNKSDMTLTFPNRSQILFKGLDDPEKIKSIQGITDIWVEEATELTAEDFRQLDLRLRGLVEDKQIILTFNPISALHWLKAEFFDRKRDDTLILRTTYKDNRFLDDEYCRVLESLKEKDYTYYQIYALGEWGVLGNLIYTNYIIEDIPQDAAAYSSTYAGIDFGFNDPSAIIRVGWKDSELYILDEFYQSGLTNAELIKRAKEIIPAGEVVTADSAEPDRIHEFRRAGFNIQPAKKGKDSVKFGIDWIKRRKIHIHPSCQNFINEIQSYKYREDKAGNVLDEPVDLNNHAMDALRYACQPLMRPSARVTDKPKGF